MEPSFWGYVRKNGDVGIRNHVLILPISFEMNQIARKIQRQVPETTTFMNQYGIDEIGRSTENTLKILVGFATHPNVSGVVILAHGTEPIETSLIVNRVLESGKNAEVITLAEVKSIRSVMNQGINAAQKLTTIRNSEARRKVSLSSIIMGTECGGSDACSGISGNPVVGEISDELISRGGTSILSETTELIGAEHLLQKRALSPEVGEQVLHLVQRMESTAMSMGVDIRGAQPAPGNIAGGITTIEEKSLGCIHKGGTTDIVEVCEYADHPTKQGLVIMDTPGHDIEQLTGMVAGGAQITLFTTGRGTPTGSPISPVIKISTNTSMYNKMKDNIDFDAGTIVEGMESVQEAASRLFKLFVEVLSGKKTKSELLGHREFGIYQRWNSV